MFTVRADKVALIGAALSMQPIAATHARWCTPICKYAECDDRGIIQIGVQLNAYSDVRHIPRMKHAA